MKKLFLISVGGSGTRVIESLIHMLAMGGKTQQWPEEIHIMLMEMDRGNGNLLRVQKLIEEYRSLHNACACIAEQNRFFSPKITPYYWYPSPGKEMQRQTLGNLVGVNEEAKILSSLLYTENEMDMTIDKGFKGRPALGVAYFGQMSLGDANGELRGEENDLSGDNKPAFNFLKAVEKGKGDDGELPRILVISSCHGGTGATGIPVLEQSLHKVFRGKDVHLGLLLMLPTFSVPRYPEESKTPIDSRTFSDKVKTVLSYYAKEEFLHERTRGKLSRGYRWTYLLGYQTPIPFDKYSEGSEEQDNPCTMFDWYATMAIRQFCGEQEEDGAKSVAEPEPGIYIASIDSTPWGYRRFEGVFPTIAKDLTSMLHTALVFRKYLTPDLERLCGDPDRYGVEEFTHRLRNLNYLQEFYSNDARIFNDTAVVDTYTPFTEYTADFIYWLYAVLSHAPTDFPEDQDADLIIRFHKLPTKSRKMLVNAFGNQRPEYIRSLVSQQFVNAPYLHKAQAGLANGIPFPAQEEGGVTDEWPGALCDYLVRAVRNLDNKKYKFSEMTTQTGVPPIQTPDILGELADHLPNRTAPDGVRDAKTWVLLMALMITIQRHHPISDGMRTQKM